MAAEGSEVSERELRLGEIAFAYLEAREKGQAPEERDLLARHPEFAEELAQFLADQAHVARLAVPVRPAALAEQARAAADPASAPPNPLGDFRIVREIGRGGMGIVYEAEQMSLKRRVALKVLPFAGALDAKQLQRFKNESQAAAQLHHTNIVPVYYVGYERGVHFYAMQYIEGSSLADMIASLRASGWRPPAGGTTSEETTRYREVRDRLADGSRSLETTPRAALSTIHTAADAAFFRTVAELGIQAAEALEHAHQLGVIHRDIKPANLMVDERGQLWITDFGLAHVQGDPKLTMTGDLVGTLRYMSPEQALGDRAMVDHRTDVYSLGATLYELLALQPAFAGHDRQELLQQIGAEEPTPPRRLNPMAPAELETIVLKAMEKNPAERYGTAQALADDLRHFLNDEPIRAKPPTFLQRARKWARRPGWLFDRY